jgi:hypothetical protein
MSTSGHYSSQTDGGGADTAAQEALSSEGGHVSASGELDRQTDHVDQEEQARLMATLGIHRDGGYCHFRGYRFVRLEEAMAYARMLDMRVSRALVDDNLPSRAYSERVKLPTDSDAVLMASLGVSFENGRYMVDGFCYECLAEAVAYATLRRSTVP